MSTDTTNAPASAGATMRSNVTATLPLIAGNAERAERDRRVPDENIAALRETGIFKALRTASQAPER